jgi:hypothetical protein
MRTHKLLAIFILVSLLVPFVPAAQAQSEEPVAAPTNSSSDQDINGGLDNYPLETWTYFPLIYKRIPDKYAISGKILYNSNPKSGVKVSLNTGEQSTTDGNGNYSFTWLNPGSYTVTPSLTDYVFNPVSRNVTVNSSVGDAFNQDFAATYTGPMCSNYVLNGNFESGTGNWVLMSTNSVAHPKRVSSQHYGGSYSMQVGIVNSYDNKDADGWFYQVVDSPFDVVSIKIGFQLKPQTGNTNIAVNKDYQSVSLKDKNGALLEYLLPRGLWNKGWTYYEYDVTDWKNKTMQLHFTVENDGKDSITFMYVDDVVMEVCVPAP